jgi:hypothetical protein
VCDCSDQAAHYHNLGPQLGASLLTRHIGWKQKKKESKNRVTDLLEDSMLAVIYFRIFLSYRSLCNNLKIKMYKTVILPVVLGGFETYALTLWKELY